MDEPRKVPIYRALHRPNLLMGAERKLMQTLIAFCGLVLISNPLSLVTWSVIAVAYGSCVAGLRKLAKIDPRFTDVYRRQVNYRPYYPPLRGTDAPRPKRELG